MSKISVVREALLELMAEHERDNTIPTSRQFLAYELVTRRVISKEKTGARHPFQIVTDALTNLRESGEIPWDWIIDETRGIDDYSGFPSIKEGVLAHLRHIPLDPWKGQLVLVLTESRSLAGVLRNLANKYRVVITSTNGQCAGFLHTKIAPLLKDAFMNGSEPPKNLYLGDYDLAGNQIQANTRSVLQEICDLTLDWEHIALTAQQVEQYELPVILKRDRRYNDSRPHEAVETEALSQKLIMELLETKLVAMLPEPLKHVHERERRQRRAIERRVDV